MYREKDRSWKLAEALGHHCRIRTLVTLGRHRDEELSLYKIARYSGIERKILQRHIPILVRNGLVQKKVYGNIPLYKLNHENQIIQKLMDLFSTARLL